MAKKKSHGGRSVSLTKRRNQRRNKLVKKGKLKPINSNDPYLRAKRLAAKKPNNKKDKNKNVNKDEHEDDSESNFDADDMADMMESDDPVLNSVPEALIRRFDEDEESKKRLLLPIKNREGNLVYREKEGGGQEDEEIEEDEIEEDQNDQEMENEEKVEKKNGEQEYENRSVLSLLSSRSSLLSSLRIEIGSAASNFLEAPQERMQVLERLISLPDSQPKEVKAPVTRLVVATVNEMLKDVLPSYRISDHDSEKSGTLLKKETLKLIRHEKLLLQCSKRHLMRLESLLHLRQVNRQSKKDLSAKTDRMLSTRCLMDLLTTHPNFNYSENIARLVVPLMDQRFQTEVRLEVRKGIETLFRQDKRGEISLKVVEMIRKWILKKNYKNCHPDLVDCLRGLRVSYLISGREMEEEEQKKKINMKKNKKDVGESRKEKKRRKALMQVEREMLEAKGEEAKSVRDKNYLEISKIIFQIVFRVVKSCIQDDLEQEKSGLLPACLKCLAAFSAAIGVEYLYDALKVLAQLVNADFLEPKLRSFCLESAFRILSSGHGEHLNIDTAPFSDSFIDLLHTPHFWAMASSSNLDSVSGLASESKPCLSLDLVPVLRTLLVKRRRLLSPGTVRHMIKHVVSFSLTLVNTEQLMNVLEAVNIVKRAHPATFQGLLEANSEESVVTPSLFVSDVNGSSCGPVVGMSETLWELQLLRLHYHPEVREMANKLLAKTWSNHHV